MIFIDDDMTIRVPQGDTGQIEFTLEGSIAHQLALFTVYVPDHDVIRKIIPIQGNVVTIHLSSAETSIPCGAYSWNMRFANGAEIDTPHEPAAFLITEAGGNAKYFKQSN